MYLTKKTKEDLFKKHGKDAKDTGSAEGQIALFTHRINHLTEHLNPNSFTIARYLKISFLVR